MKAIYFISNLFIITIVGVSVISIALTQPQKHEAYVSPQGAGIKDGRSREHAAAATGEGLQKAWDALPAGGTLYLMPGEYSGVSLDIAASEDKKTRRLEGVVDGDRRAVFVGDFDKNRPEKAGGHIITIREGASRWSLKNLDFRNVNTAVYLLGGNVQGTIEDVRVYGAREGFRFEGKGKAKEVSKDISVERCVFEHFTKRGLRLRPGHDGVRVTDCRADAGGKEWATEPFHMGFAVEEGCDNVTFTDCVARGSYNDAGTAYWNGDGFCAESGSGTITWVRCSAFDNTDGGWDTKADLSVFEDCIALRNKRNIRIWGKATLKHCLAAFPQYPRGSDGACVWSKGEVQMNHCTLVGSRPVECEDDGRVTLEKSFVVILPMMDGEREPFPPKGTSVTDSDVKQTDETGLNGMFLAPDKTFEDGTGFNRSGAGATAGFRHRKLGGPDGEK